MKKNEWNNPNNSRCASICLKDWDFVIRAVLSAKSQKEPKVFPLQGITDPDFIKGIHWFKFVYKSHLKTFDGTLTVLNKPFKLSSNHLCKSIKCSKALVTLTISLGSDENYYFSLSCRATDF